MNVCLITAGARDDAAPLVESLRTLASNAATWTVAIPGPAGGDEGTVRVAAVSDLAGEQFDIAIAADWRAARWLFEVAATRHVLVVGELAHEDLHPADTDRVLATVAINLPVDLIATSATVADELRAMRPEARVLLATGEAAGVLDEIRAGRFWC